MRPWTERQKVGMAERADGPVEGRDPRGPLAGAGQAEASRPAFPPRGLIVGTGEQAPPGPSVLARALVLPVASTDVNMELLTTAQAQSARLCHAMSAYLGWLAPQMPELAGPVRTLFEQTRTRARAGDEHGRVPEVLAHLWLGFHLALRCAEELGALGAWEAETIRTKGWEAFRTLGEAQTRRLAAERPARRFLELLFAVLTQRRGVLLPRTDEGEGLVDLLGWYRDESLYLVPESAYVIVARFCRDAGSYFPVRQGTLARDLAEEKITDCDAGRHTRTVQVAGKTRRVWSVRRDVVEALLGQDVPISPPPDPVMFSTHVSYPHKPVIPVRPEILETLGGWGRPQLADQPSDAFVGDPAIRPEPDALLGLVVLDVDVVGQLELPPNSATASASEKTRSTGREPGGQPRPSRRSSSRRKAAATTRRAKPTGPVRFRRPVAARAWRAASRASFA
jgi:hypothetical protein